MTGTSHRSWPSSLVLTGESRFEPHLVLCHGRTSLSCRLGKARPLVTRFKLRATSCLGNGSAPKFSEGMRCVGRGTLFLLIWSAWWGLGLAGAQCGPMAPSTMGSTVPTLEHRPWQILALPGIESGRVRWLMPVTPTLWEAEAVRSLEHGSSTTNLGLHGQTPGSVPVVSATWRHFTLGDRQSETLSQTDRQTTAILCPSQGTKQS